MASRRMWGLCVLVILIVAPSVWAQTQITTGVVQGTVLDESGAVVPGATVTIRNLETNLERTLTSDGGGRFVFLQLSPGHYTLQVAKQGFTTVVQENFPLTVGQTVPLTLTIKVSPRAEQIVVTATPTIDTVKTESSSTINDLSVTTTPVLGRKFEDLLTLTPGVSIVQGPDGDEITFAGQRGIFNNISLDGGDYNNGFFGEQMGGQRAAIDITMDAVKEFQVVATGGSAEFGRTAGGIVNVITKSGTNEVHGSLFYFQRLEALSANTSDGKPLKDFHREQFGGTIGGPIKKDKMFIFAAGEQIISNLTRANLSEQVGATACPVAAPTILVNEALINSNQDCQRRALITFFRTNRSQEEGNPVNHPIRNTSLLGKWDWNVTPANQFSLSYSFDRSRNENQTFDVATYGNSANGIEGASKIHVLNFNLFSTVSPTKFNEAHFTYSREERPRAAIASNVPADTGAGFSPSFRFGSPFFLNPTIDELFWRTQFRDSFSIVHGKHTIKFGGEWIHSLNDQVFRGFFTGRYLFDSVSGFLRYASPAGPGGFGPTAVACSNGTFVTAPTTCTLPATATGGPLLFYLQDGIPSGVSGVPAPGASNIKNEDFSFYIQDKWQIRPNFNLSFGLRWDAQIFPNPVIPPAQTAYGIFLSNPRFPSDGTLHDQKKQWQPRVGFAWDVANNGKSVVRASYSVFYARQNMLTQVGSITTNGAQQRTIFSNTTFGGGPVWPNIFTPGAPSGCVAPPNPSNPSPFQCFTGVRVFSKNYSNPRVYSANFSFEQELAPNWALYVDFTWTKGVHLTRFVNANVGDLPTACCAISNAVQVPTTSGDSIRYTGPSPFGIQLGDVFVAESSAKSLYRGLTIGMRKRFSQSFQLEWNYVYSKDKDDDSNERDPFTDRAFNRFDFSRDYAPSDRDIRHKFNFYTYWELPARFQLTGRIQGRSAQPITTNFVAVPSGAACSPTNSNTRVVSGTDCGRNHLRKNNKYFSLDWRLARPFTFRERYSLIPMIEMFNTFNNDNNVNPLITPALFNFDGFLRTGVGDPLQVQFAVKFTF